MPCSLEIESRNLVGSSVLRPDFNARRSLQRSSSPTGINGLIYRSEAMQNVCRLIQKVAACDVSVLVEGETGTGKELVAQAIHEQSTRKDKPFPAQNTGALPDALIESELFGHRRGAFTGAVEARSGLFEAASGGSLFLDEIGEASAALQVRLLRLLETGTYRRIGDNAPRSANVRIIAATHRDLKAEVERGNFREDLLYRLCIFPIRLPPLRERREDIPLLVQYFVEQANRQLGTAIRTISKETLDHLQALPWRGNVRELKNTVQRLAVLSTGTTLATPETPRQSEMIDDAVGQHETFLRPIAEVERDHILRVLTHVGGNQSEAARILGLKRGTLRGRLKKLGIA